MSLYFILASVKLVALVALFHLGGQFGAEHKWGAAMLCSFLGLVALGIFGVSSWHLGYEGACHSITITFPRDPNAGNCLIPVVSRPRIRRE